MQDEDSDDYSGLFDETETAEQEEEIGWDTLGLPETQTTQMSLFDTDAYAQETPADGQPVSSLGIQYSQEIVDEALRIGANDPNSRLIICAYFMKDKPLEENIRFLKEHYKTNGAGFYFQDRPYSIWYDQDGIRLSSGESAQGKTAFVISWEQAAVHIRELLDDAQYMTWDELTRVADFELGELADSLVFLCRDMDENGRKQNLLPSIRAIQGQRLTFPDEREAVMELLRQPGAMHMLEEEMSDFLSAYAQDRDILRFHYHHPREIYQHLIDMQRPPVRFPAETDFEPQTRHFITLDEMDKVLRGLEGENIEQRLSIHSFFLNHSDAKEREKFMRGIHGEYSGSYGGNDERLFTTKGVSFGHKNGAKAEWKWNKAVKRIDALMKQDRLLFPSDRDAMPEYERKQVAWQITSAFSDAPEEIQRPYSKDPLTDYWENVAEVQAQLTDPQKTEEIRKNLFALVEMTLPNDRNGEIRRQALQTLEAYQNGTYSLFGEKRQAVEASTPQQEVSEEKPAPQPDLPQNTIPPQPDQASPVVPAVRRDLTQADIDAALQEWNGSMDSKRAVARYMREHGKERSTAEWLRKEYGDDLPAFPVTVEGAAGDISWARVQRGIARLLQEDRFFTDEEQDRFEDIDPVYIREQLAQNGIVGGEIVDQEAFDRSPINRELDALVASVQEAEKAEAETEKPEEAPTSREASPPLMPGERLIPEHDGIPAMRELVIELTPRNREEPVAVQEAPLSDAEKTPVFHTQSGTSYRVGDEIESQDKYGDAVRMRIERIEDGSVWLSSPARTPDNPYEIYQSVFEKYIDDGRFEGVQQEASFVPPVQTESEAPAAIVPDPTAQNFRITDDHLGEGGQKTKFRNNLNAIYVLKLIESENRTATPEEQEVLSKYVGWGGIPNAFDDNKPDWADEYAELKDALTPDEYSAARASTLNAHYTSPTVIRSIYEALGNMGFKTGNILEPAMGVGNFFGMLPEDMRESKLYGVELDSITGRIAQQLYPKADITVAGFETTDRRDFFDVAVGNVPFGNYKVIDRAYDKLGFNIHNYFFAKTLDQVRPGGIVAFVTSKYTMDAKSPEMRKYLAQRAELLGAIRLPNNAFKANAGTEVTSDIIFLQKRDRPIDIEPDWVHLGETEDGVPVNSYFAEHPEMVLGKMAWNDSMYGYHGETAYEPIEGADLSQQLAEAIRHIDGSYQEAELSELGEDEAITESIPADPNVKNYTYTVKDGQVYFRQNSVMVRPDLNATALERVKGMVALRDCVHDLMDAQLHNYTDAAIAEKQAELNRLYDGFTQKFGLINSRGNALAFSADSSYYLLCSLEVIDEEGNFERKADMFSKRTIRQQKQVDHVDTAVEALAVSIGERAQVDLPFMARLSGKTEEEIVEELTGVIFRLPEPADDQGKPRYVTADEYLSGNVRQKLREARAAAEISPIFDVNVQALEKAQPQDLDASEIDVRLGATWVDKKYIQQFMYETFNTPVRYIWSDYRWANNRRAIAVNFSAYTSEWNVTNKSAISSMDVAANTTFGTSRINAYEILENTLNLRDVRIYDTVKDPDGKERRVLNPKETTLAQQKQQAIKDAFREWIWEDPERRDALVQTYNERFNSTRPREFDGSHIVFAGMNPEISLREHQRNAIAHILYGGNTLLAHQVGAGKTFEMAAAAMESKRLGLCQKPMFVVPNHLTEQWASEFLRLYPSANILVTTKRDFERANRKKFCARIATGDYDAVIIGHSQFERIPVSYERQKRLLEDQIEEITLGIEEMEANNGERFSIKQLERTKRQLEARLEKLQANHRKDDVVTFEQLGVDRLYVDEAHSFKNLFLYTKMNNVAGLSTSEAQKSQDMFLKCRYIDEVTDGRGVVFATGTPVSNSMTELYTMQRYLQYGALREHNLTHFDAWASVFGETTTAIELAPEGTGYRARTRFAKFFNLPELMTLFKEVADIKTADQLNLPTPEAHYDTVVVKPSEQQKEMVASLSERAAAVHSGIVDPSDDNMLKITSDGRKLGLDQRLINPMLPDDPDSKVNACVRNIYRIWDEGQADRLTQLVFCDLSTPKGGSQARALPIAAKAAPETLNREEAPIEETVEQEIVDLDRFSVYEDIRDKLVDRGIPPEQIAFIHDANTEAKKKELFAKVRAGQVRVLIGSTAKMGAGTNVQDRLIASHDLDCPWRPGDLEQRAGRIVRQGNKNKEVHIYRYVTEGTFDAYLWQTVENKQKFISQIMTSKSPVRSCEDVDETALSYAEIKALCAGDPRIKEKMDLDVEVAKLKLMKADHDSKRYKLQDRLRKYFPENIKRGNEILAALQQDLETVRAHPLPEKGFVGIEIKGDFLTDRENAGAALIQACKDLFTDHTKEIGSYRGFPLHLEYDAVNKKFELTLHGALSHRVEISTGVLGNLQRIENVLKGIPDRINATRLEIQNLENQVAAAQEEVAKPFPQEEALKVKSARLAQLDSELNIDTHHGGDRDREENAFVAKRSPSPALSSSAASQQKKHKQEAR